MIKKFIGMAVLSAALSLTACSYLNEKWDKRFGPGEKNMAQNEVTEVTSKGAGQLASFDETDTRAQAPHNQIYHFDFDSSVVHNDDLISLQAQAKYLAAHPQAKILLTGHTDERGSREYNVALGERRDVSVADLLRLNGAQPSQIRLVSYGEEKPIALGHDTKSYTENRRVELIYEDLG